RVPDADADRPAAHDGGEQAAVTPEPAPDDRVRVGDFPLELPLIGVPALEATVLAGRVQGRPVRAESEDLDRSAVAQGRPGRRPGGRLPDPGRAVKTTGRKIPPVRTEGQANNDPGLAGFPAGLAGGQVPKAAGLIGPPGQHGFAVGAEGNGPDILTLPMPQGQ